MLFHFYDFSHQSIGRGANFVPINLLTDGSAAQRHSQSGSKHNSWKHGIIILFYHLLPEMYEKVKLLHGLGCLSCDTLTITLKLIKIQFQKTTF